MSIESVGAFERLRLTGPHSASLRDLVAVGFSRREDDTEANLAKADMLIQKFGKINRFRDLSASDLKEAFGLEGFEVLKCLSLIEMGRRTAMSGRGQIKYVENPEDAFELLSEYRQMKREFFLVILLDAKNAVMRIAEVHIGTLTSSLVGAREVFREAIREGACSIIVAHNHPSGDPTPSPEDYEVTRKLREIGDLLDIRLLDHFVIGERYAVRVGHGGRVGG